MFLLMHPVEGKTRRFRLRAKDNYERVFLKSNLPGKERQTEALGMTAVLMFTSTLAVAL